MAHRKRRRKFHFEELEGLLERPDPQAEGVQEEAEKTLQSGGEHAAADSPQARVLELQKTAGNRAVGAALNRETTPASSATAQWPKTRQLIVDGSVIPLESFNDGMASARSGTGSTKPRADEFTGPGEVNAMVPVGEWSEKLYRAATDGTPFKTVEIVIPTKDGKGIRIILTSVWISSFASASGGVHQLTLQFEKRTFTQTPPP